MENYIPDIYQKSIFDINYDTLKTRGIKCLLIDLENTISPIAVKEPNRKVRELFDELKTKGFKVIIFSNAPKKKVKPFKEILDVESCANAKKPFQKKYNQIIKKFNYNVSEIACIGDQLITDIKGGNKVGITTILVNPIGTKDRLITKFGRLLEKRILQKLRDNNLFSRGKYYE